MNVTLTTPTDGTVTVEVSTRFDDLSLDQALAVAAVLGEDTYQALIADDGVATEEAVLAVIWVRLLALGYAVEWEEMAVA